MKIETGERRLLSSHDAVEPSWSPYGRRVAYRGLDDATSALDLFTVAADGSQSEPAAAVRLLSDPHVDWTNWSGDGRALLFASSRGGTMNLWRIDLDPETGRPLGAPEPATAPSSWAGYLTASTNGRRIAFVDCNVRTAVRIAAFDSAAGRIAGSPRGAPIGTVEANGPVSLSPDGATGRTAIARALSSTSRGAESGLSSLPLSRERSARPPSRAMGTFSPGRRAPTSRTSGWPS